MCHASATRRLPVGCMQSHQVHIPQDFILPFQTPTRMQDSELLEGRFVAKPLQPAAQFTLQVRVLGRRASTSRGGGSIEHLEVRCFRPQQLPVTWWGSSVHLEQVVQLDNFEEFLPVELNSRLDFKARRSTKYTSCKDTSLPAPPHVNECHCCSVSAGVVARYTLYTKSLGFDVDTNHASSS